MNAKSVGPLLPTEVAGAVLKLRKWQAQVTGFLELKEAQINRCYEIYDSLCYDAYFFREEGAERIKREREAAKSWKARYYAANERYVEAYEEVVRLERQLSAAEKGEEREKIREALKVQNSQAEHLLHEWSSISRESTETDRAPGSDCRMTLVQVYNEILAETLEINQQVGNTRSEAMSGLQARCPGIAPQLQMDLLPDIDDLAAWIGDLPTKATFSIWLAQAKSVRACNEAALELALLLNNYV